MGGRGSSGGKRSAGGGGVTQELLNATGKRDINKILNQIPEGGSISLTLDSGVVSTFKHDGSKWGNRALAQQSSGVVSERWISYTQPEFAALLLRNIEDGTIKSAKINQS